MIATSKNKIVEVIAYARFQLGGIRGSMPNTWLQCLQNMNISFN